MSWNFSPHWIYFSPFEFLSNLRLPWKQRVPWNFSLYWIHFLHSGFLSKFAIDLKNSVCPVFFTVLNILFHSWFLSNFRLTWKTECARKFFTVLSILFTFRSYEQLCACPEKQSVPWIFSMYWIYFLHSGFLSHLRFPWKTACALKFFTVLNILFNIWIYEQLPLGLKNKVCPAIFHCVEYTFCIQDFWATCVCHEERVCSKNFHCIEYTFYIQDFWATCACPENRVWPENFHSIEYTFYIQDLWANLRLAWKRECALNFFTVLNIAFTFRIFEQIAIALKNRVCPEIFHCIEYTLYNHDFWATCTCLEEQSMP